MKRSPGPGPGPGPCTNPPPAQPEPVHSSPQAACKMDRQITAYSVLYCTVLTSSPLLQTQFSIHRIDESVVLLLSGLLPPISIIVSFPSPGPGPGQVTLKSQGHDSGSKFTGPARSRLISCRYRNRSGRHADLSTCFRLPAPAPLAPSQRFIHSFIHSTAVS